MQDHPADERPERPPEEMLLEACAQDLAAAIEAALPGWVRRCVLTRLAQAGLGASEDLAGAVDDAAELASREVTPRVRELLRRDIDDQRGSPLEALRSAVVYPTAVLRRAGVPPVIRDEFSEREFPEDDYALVPSSFADVDESLHEPGLRWGAAKAHLHLARRRAEGLR